MADPTRTTGEVLERLWRFEAVHPDWEQGDDWPREVAWWAVGTRAGLVLIDPLVEDWRELDGLVAAAGGCAAIVRTCLWHERSIAAARERYGADVWAQPAADENTTAGPFDQPAAPGQLLPGGIEALEAVRDDELALWLADQQALVFGDVMLRDGDGGLHLCPESWMRRDGGIAPLRTALEPLLDRAPEHVLVSHGPLVLGDGTRALAHALSEPA